MNNAWQLHTPDSLEQLVSHIPNRGQMVSGQLSAPGEGDDQATAVDGYYLNVSDDEPKTIQFLPANQEEPIATAVTPETVLAGVVKIWLREE